MHLKTWRPFPVLQPFLSKGGEDILNSELWKWRSVQVKYFMQIIQIVAMVQKSRLFIGWGQEW